MVSNDIERVAKMLAGEHCADDPGMTQILWFPHEREIRLLEVSSSVGSTGEVLPFRFSKDPPDVPYESVVILVGERDWERLQNQELDLPNGWTKPERIVERMGG